MNKYRDFGIAVILLAIGSMLGRVLLAIDPNSENAVMFATILVGAGAMVVWLATFLDDEGAE